MCVPTKKESSEYRITFTVKFRKENHNTGNILKESLIITFEKNKKKKIKMTEISRLFECRLQEDISLWN